MLFTCVCPIPRNAGLDRPDIAGRSRSGAHPNAVLQSLLSIPPWQDFGMPVFFRSDLCA